MTKTFVRNVRRIRALRQQGYLYREIDALIFDNDKEMHELAKNEYHISHAIMRSARAKKVK